MRRLGIRGVSLKPMTSMQGKRKQRKKYPYLLKGKKIRHVNQALAMDFSYVRLPSEMIYVVAIINLFSRKILSHRVSSTMDRYAYNHTLRSAFWNYLINNNKLIQVILSNII